MPEITQVTIQYCVCVCVTHTHTHTTALILCDKNNPQTLNQIPSAVETFREKFITCSTKVSHFFNAAADNMAAQTAPARATTPYL